MNELESVLILCYYWYQSLNNRRHLIILQGCRKFIFTIMQYNEVIYSSLNFVCILYCTGKLSTTNRAYIVLVAPSTHSCISGLHIYLDQTQKIYWGTWWHKKRPMRASMTDSSNCEPRQKRSRSQMAKFHQATQCIKRSNSGPNTSLYWKQFKTWYTWYNSKFLLRN